MTRQQKPTINEILGAAVIHLHRQLVALRLKLQAERKTVDAAHAKQAIVPLAQRQSVTAGPAGILRHDRRLGGIARAARYRGQIDPTAFELQIILAQLRGKQCQVGLAIDKAVAAIFEHRGNQQNAVGNIAPMTEMDITRGGAGSNKRH